MQMLRITAAAVLAAALLALPAAAGGRDDAARAALTDWYRLVLELVRHTPTYSPPVAARALGYLGVAAWEAEAGGEAGRRSLAGQLNGLGEGPARAAGAHDAALVLHGALAAAVPVLFANTGPTGQRAMAAMAARIGARLAEGVAPEVAARSLAHGRAVAAHILAWAAADGGAVVENMGFPLVWTSGGRPESWVPTSLIVQQQTPLLPLWGDVRPFAMPAGGACPLPPPTAYSEVPGSAFHAEAVEVWQVSRALTEEQKLVARFWSDDPMLSPTPPGHWIAIALQIIDRDAIDDGRAREILARLGIALADSFIACWHSKYAYDLLRPVTYINRLIDPGWQPYLITPPFPEYPSGHSTESAAAAAVLTALLGAPFAFEDATHEDDGLGVRAFASFRAAAEEAGISRLWGGIHFRAAVERGLDQGDCVAAHAIALRFGEG